MLRLIEGVFAGGYVVWSVERKVKSVVKKLNAVKI